MWHGATGGVGGGLSRSDKKKGRVSSGGGGATQDGAQTFVVHLRTELFPGGNSLSMISRKE